MGGQYDLEMIMGEEKCQQFHLKYNWSTHRHLTLQTPVKKTAVLDIGDSLLFAHHHNYHFLTWNFTGDSSIIFKARTPQTLVLFLFYNYLYIRTRIMDGFYLSVLRQRQCRYLHLFQSSRLTFCYEKINVSMWWIISSCFSCHKQAKLCSRNAISFYWF